MYFFYGEISLLIKANYFRLINTSKHLIIKNIHPSPLAQSKGDFTNSEQFSQTNEYLIKNGIEPINWEIK